MNPKNLAIPAFVLTTCVLVCACTTADKFTIHDMSDGESASLEERPLVLEEPCKYVAGADISGKLAPGRCNLLPSGPRHPRIQVPGNPFISSRLAICRYRVTRANTISRASSASEKMALFSQTSSCIQTCLAQVRLRMKASGSDSRRKIVATRCNRSSEPSRPRSRTSVMPRMQVPRDA